MPHRPSDSPTSIRLVLGALAAVALGSGCTGAAPNPDPPASPTSIRSLWIATDFTRPTVVLTPVGLRRLLTPATPSGWSPAANIERPRGGTEVYAAAGPATVVVRTADGHGTGFLVSPEGLIVTNHHVIESGLSHDETSSFATVHLGRIGPDGVMTLDAASHRARLLADDPVNDLALLKLERAAGAAPLPFVALARAAPRPGMDCAIVGHPSSGMLWTYRPCQVSSIGDYPRDMVNVVMLRLSSRGATQAQVEAFVNAQPARRIMLTSAQANPGDSGGPVLDRTGALIGVTFAGPGNTAEDKFTYHVHLDEVRRLLADVPSSPMFLVPDPWSFGETVEPVDVDGDGKMDVLVAGSSRPEVLLFDLDNDSPAALLGSAAGLSQLVAERKWDFEAGIDLRGSGYASFYDTSNRGQHDLVFVTDEDAMSAKGKFVRGGDGRWTYQKAAQGDLVMAPGHLKDAALARRLQTVLQALERRRN